MAVSQIRRLIQAQVSETPAWVRDTCLGLLASAVVAAAWSLLWPGEAVKSAPVAIPVSAVVPALPLSPDAREAQSGPTGAPLLWAARSGKATVYLFGSIHVLKPGLDWMDARLFRAFDSADAAWFEVPDLDALPKFKGFAARVMASKPVLTQGLNAVETQQLELILNRYNMTTKEQERVRPWAVAGLISELDRDGGGFSLDRGADMTLFHRALALKHQTGGFEDNTEHYGYLYALGEGMGEDGTQALKRALAAHFGTGDLDGSLDVMAKAWRNGDERAMTASLLKDRARNPRLYDLLLVTRNARWMPKIEAMLKAEKTTFIVAGADHFIGPDGLVAQLRARGYAVERIDP